MIRSLMTLALVLTLVLPLAAEAATRAEQRAEIHRVQAASLTRLFRAEPEIEGEVAKAAGYAVFTSADVAILYVSGGMGHGLAHNNLTGADTYMNMASLGVGLGLGVKDYRVVFVFDTPEAFDKFVSQGLDLSGNVDAAVQKGTKGGSLTGVEDVLKNTRVYQMTDKGLMAQLMLKGTKYWPDNDLNRTDK